MTKLHLKYVQSFGGYHYFRRRGMARIPLPGIPGSREFMDAYQTALAAAPVAIGASTRSKPGSVSAALAEYYQSHDFGRLTGETPAARRGMLEKFRDRYGDRPLASLPKDFIIALLDRMPPHSARSWLVAFRHFVRWAETRKLIRSDPTWGIRVKVPASDGHHTWTEDEIAQYEAHHAIGSKERLALALGLFTAQRRGDVVRIGRQHIRDGVLTVRQNKTGKTLAIPMHIDLVNIIEATPIAGLTLLSTRRGRTFSPNNLTDQFRIWCDQAGLPQRCVFHGLRKAAARRLAEAGCTAHEIASMTGHASLREVERYTKAVDQVRLAKAAMAKTAEQTSTESVKPVRAEVSKPLIALAKK